MEDRKMKVIDQNILTLNSYKVVRLANLDKAERVRARFNKEVATYLLENWDDLGELEVCERAISNDKPDGCDEVVRIYKKRIKQLKENKS